MPDACSRVDFLVKGGKCRLQTSVCVLPLVKKDEGVPRGVPQRPFELI